MGDGKVIDFNELKNKVNDGDVDKFEGYMFDLFYKTQSGSMNMAEYASEISKYMTENNISEKKLFEIQKKMMERYGFDISGLEGSMANLGLNVNLDSGTYEDVRKKMSFEEKYNKKIVKKSIEEYEIKNEINNLKVVLEGVNVTLLSEKTVDLTDNELNEFLCSYKKVVGDKQLNVTICSNINSYPY
ncbi:DUF3867 family protein [Clostridium thermobutyricum]|uniref:DUF3867 domain-containing protein n=2 Tax=Clostridium thermobutyricum TaxID=29372 RepID=N9WGX1_9CLOT|nr:DUF3867 family protein [Clostridium thermobutyricum]ENZ02336.1 hypothetical protein HMPREF1092_01571 [Clostridium thermobutyricum]OPX49340.1 hypothetical protein CLTHE_07220 [Clostridium thermobutyricum DSM 4928]